MACRVGKLAWSGFEKKAEKNIFQRVLSFSAASSDKQTGGNYRKSIGLFFKAGAAGAAATARKRQETELLQGLKDLLTAVAPEPKQAAAHDDSWVTVVRKGKAAGKGKGKNSVSEQPSLLGILFTMLKRVKAGSSFWVKVDKMWRKKEIDSYAAASSAIDDGENPSGSLVVASWQQCTELRSVAQTHGLFKAYVLVCKDSLSEEQAKMAKEQKGVEEWLQLHVQKWKKLWCFPFKDNMPEWPPEPQVVDVKQGAPEVIDLATLRVSISQQFVHEQEWEDAMKKQFLSSPKLSGTALLVAHMVGMNGTSLEKILLNTPPRSPSWAAPKVQPAVVVPVTGCEFHRLQHSLQGGPTDDSLSTVQQEWDLFMSCLNRMFIQTIRDLRESSTDESVLSELRKLDRQQGLRAKGSQAMFQWVNIPYKCKGDPHPGERGRLLRRRLARPFEIRRICRRHVLTPEELLRKVWPHEMLPVTCQGLLQKATSDIERVQTHRVEWEQTCKQEAFASWKRRINQPDLKPLGAWLRRKTRTPECVSLTSEGAEDLADAMPQLLVQRKGYLASMDFSQAFDHMHPLITCSGLHTSGFPPQLALLLRNVWGGLHRFVEYEGFVASTTLQSGCAMPQGDPLAPLICACWVSSGIRWVERDINEQVIYGCYMDDRNFWSPDVDQVIQRILRWQQWSEKMGLRENPMKTQVTSKTFRDYEVLLGKAPQWAKPEIKLLGVTTTTCRRSNSDSENIRISESMQRARALYTLPLRWEQRVRAYQSFVLSKAAYGWIGMLTLFMTVSQGIDWQRALMPLFEVSTVAVGFMLLYVVLTTFAILNVPTLTGLGVGQHFEVVTGASLLKLLPGCRAIDLGSFTGVNEMQTESGWLLKSKWLANG
eukprot:s3013_g12.t1